MNLKMTRERNWLVRFIAASDFNIVEIRFGNDNPKQGETKEPDFLMRIQGETPETIGIELVSAFTVDENNKPSIDPNSLFPPEEEWSATVTQWERAIRKEIKKKLETKTYSRHGLDRLWLLVCDETNGKDPLFNGHRYIDGFCYWLLYDPQFSGTPFMRLTSLQRCGDGLASVNSAGFDEVHAITRNDDGTNWLALGVNMDPRPDSFAAKILPVVCQHDRPLLGLAFGIYKPYSGIAPLNLAPIKSEGYRNLFRIVRPPVANQ